MAAIYFDLDGTSCFIVIVIVMVSFFCYKYMLRNLKLPPGPYGLPIIGYMHKISSKPLHLVLDELSNSYGDIFSLSLGSRFTVALNSKKALKAAFVKQAKTFGGRPNFATYDSTRLGLTGVSLCNYTDEYKENRRAVVKAFGRLLSDADALNNVMRDETIKMLDRFNQYTKTDDAIMDPSSDFYTIVPAVMMNVMFGKSLGYQNKTLLQVVESNKKWFDSAEATNPADYFKLFELLPNPRLKVVKECSSTFLSFILQRIKEFSFSSRAMFENISQQRYRDSATNESSRKELAKLLADVLGGGFDTVAGTLAWGILCLSKHNDVLIKCREEIQSASEENLTIGDERKTPYFKATVYELFRLYPAAPLGLPRLTLADTTISNYVIPKNTMVLANIHAINRDGNVWEKPNEFYPGHFILSDGGFDNDAKMNVCTFSSGVRSCPAQKFAFYETFILLGSLISNFDIELFDPPADMLPRGGLTSQPKPYKVKLSNVIY